MDGILWQSIDGLHDVSACTCDGDVHSRKGIRYSQAALFRSQEHLRFGHVSKPDLVILIYIWIAMVGVFLTVCLVTRIQKIPRLLVAAADGYLYLYNLDPQEGGECTLMKQHK